LFLETMGFHTSLAGTSAFSPMPNAFIGHTPALMIRRLANPAAGSFTAIRLFCEIRQEGKYASVHTAQRRNLTTQQSPVILDLCSRKTRAEKSRDYRDVIVFGKLHFQNVFRPHENAKLAFTNSSSLKSVFDKLCFHDGLVNRNRAAFSNVSAVKWTRTHSKITSSKTPDCKYFK